MSPSRPFIERPIATSLLMLAVLLAGLVAFHFLSLSALPEVDGPDGVMGPPFAPVRGLSEAPFDPAPQPTNRKAKDRWTSNTPRIG